MGNAIDAFMNSPEIRLWPNCPPREAAPAEPRQIRVGAANGPHVMMRPAAISFPAQQAALPALALAAPDARHLGQPSRAAGEGTSEVVHDHADSLPVESRAPSFPRVLIRELCDGFAELQGAQSTLALEMIRAKVLALAKRHDQSLEMEDIKAERVFAPHLRDLPKPYYQILAKPLPQILTKTWAEQLQLKASASLGAGGWERVSVRIIHVVTRELRCTIGGGRIFSSEAPSSSSRTAHPLLQDAAGAHLGGAKRLRDEHASECARAHPSHAAPPRTPLRGATAAYPT